MANMRMLIRIVFVIFIAKGIDCLGGVCDDCCDCFKEKKEEEKKGENNDENNDKEIKEYEEIKEDENNTAKSLVNDNWYKAKEENKENNLVLKIFKKKDDNAFQSKENGDKISIKLAENDNSKIEYLQENEDKLKLNNQKYALFEIKTNTNKTVYLYCSDVESIGNEYNKDVIYGIFAGTTHISISVIACDTENVRDMAWMFYKCSSLKNLDIKNLNTTNIIDMKYMFYGCSSLEELDLKNFNTTSVTEMRNMFSGCSSLKKLDLKNFNTKNVSNMACMFFFCGSLTELDLKNFNTENVRNMSEMFYGCSELKKINFGQNFNTTNVTNMNNMFDWCSSFPEDIRNKLNNVEEVIKFFKEKNN